MSERAQRAVISKLEISKKNEIKSYSNTTTLIIVPDTYHRFEYLHYGNGWFLKLILRNNMHHTISVPTKPSTIDLSDIELYDYNTDWY